MSFPWLLYQYPNVITTAHVIMRPSSAADWFCQIYQLHHRMVRLYDAESEKYMHFEIKKKYNIIYL